MQECVRVVQHPDSIIDSLFVKQRVLFWEILLYGFPILCAHALLSLSRTLHFVVDYILVHLKELLYWFDYCGLTFVCDQSANHTQYQHKHSCFLLRRLRMSSVQKDLRFKAFWYFKVGLFGIQSREYYRLILREAAWKISAIICPTRPSDPLSNKRKTFLKVSLHWYTGAPALSFNEKTYAESGGLWMTFLNGDRQVVAVWVRPPTDPQCWPAAGSSTWNNDTTFPPPFYTHLLRLYLCVTGRSYQTPQLYSGRECTLRGALLLRNTVLRPQISPDGLMQVAEATKTN